MGHFGLYALPARQVLYQYGVVREGAGPLVIVVPGFGDKVPDVEQNSKMEEEGEDAGDYFCVVSLGSDPWEEDHEASASILYLLAILDVLVDSPVELHGVVATDIDHEQYHAVLDKDIEEREAKAQELQLLRILA